MGATAAVSAGSQAGMSLVNGYENSLSQRQQAQFQQQQFEANKRLADLQAQDSKIRGDKAAADSGRRTGQMIGSQRAAAGASGVDVNSGSAAEIQSQTAGLGALDRLTIQNNAWREAWGYQEQALQYEGQGQFAMMAGNASANNSLMTGGMQAVGYGGQAAYYYSSSKSPTPQPTPKK